MTKKEMVTAILEDMVSKNPTQKRSIDLEWGRWLSRQHKCKLEEIMTNRGIKF